MADLQLEKLNTAVKQTTLLGSPRDLGPKRLKDFEGAHILTVIPDNSLVEGDGPDSNNFGGVFGRGVGTGPGLRGTSTSGFGVLGEVEGGTSERMSAGVAGMSRHGTGVFGDGSPGVIGRCSERPVSHPPDTKLGHFAGVNGQSIIGPGVHGEGKYGGEFKGTSAQLRLVPASGVGPPTSEDAHFMGELFMDSQGSLFVCVASGMPGTWKRIQTI